MADINDLDLKAFIDNAMKEVFDTMLSMDLDTGDVDIGKLDQGKRIVGSVGFAGEVNGSFSIVLSYQFAKDMTCSMLGMEDDELDDDEEVNDVIGEVSNMVGGDLKSRLCDAGLPCELSIPSITTGNDFSIETKGWTRHEKFGYQHDDDVALVEIFIKPGD